MKIVALLLLALTCTFLHAQTSLVPVTPAQGLSVSSKMRQVIAQIIGETIVEGQAYEYDRQIADEIGPRLTGSSNYLKAVDWSMKHFQNAGLTNVHTELFTTDTWEPEQEATGTIISPVVHDLHVYNYGWSLSAPPEGITARVFYPSDLGEQALIAQRDQIRGSLVVLDHKSIPKPFTVAKLAAMLSSLGTMQPAGLLAIGGANGTSFMSDAALGGALAQVPVAGISREDLSLLQRLLEKGPVTAHISFTNKTHKRVQVPQVIAEIPGSEFPDQIVIVSAHLDSWQHGTGAQDDGTGVATILDAARELQSLPVAPKRTIRFVLFGGEEQYLVGSAEYVRRHASDLSKIIAIVDTDTGSERAQGWHVIGRADEEACLAQLKPLLSGLGSDDIDLSTELLFQSDYTHFVLNGVPTLALWTGMTKYATILHKAADTFDSVDKSSLLQGDATVIATVYALANSSTPFAPRLSTDDVKKLLEKTGDYQAAYELRALHLTP